MKRYILGAIFLATTNSYGQGFKENYEYSCVAEIDILGDLHKYQLSFFSDIDYRNNDHFIYNDAKITIENDAGVISIDEVVSVERETAFLSVGQAKAVPSGVFVRFYRDTFTINFDIQVLQFYGEGRGKFSPLALCTNLEFAPDDEALLEWKATP